MSATIGERLFIAQLAARNVLATASSLLAASPISRWRLMDPRVDGFLLIPSDIWPTDPGLANDIAAGQMGLGGRLVEVAGGSPFAIRSPHPAWVRDLHGFGWLGSLRAADDEAAAVAARRLVGDWCRRYRGTPGGRGPAAEPAVLARRVTSWLTGTGFLLEDADAAFYQLFTRCLGAEIRALDALSRRSPPGYSRLLCRMTLLLASLAVEGHDRDLPRHEAAVSAELQRQVLADGGHASRNPEVVLDLLLDLLPIRQCYAARGLVPPMALVKSIERMQRHLRTMTLSNGALARFNGASGGRVEAMAAVLAVEAAPGRIETGGPGPSGYARLERGGTTLIADCGGPPTLLFAGRAHAGSLSFELAHEGVEIIVNAGASRTGGPGVITRARATASHSTLVVDGRWSSRLVGSERLGRLIGGAALAGPDHVTARLEDVDGKALLVSVHNGYVAPSGLLHERRLTLAGDGLTLEGIDILRPPSGTLRLARDLPVAVHFHVPVESSMTGDGTGAIVIEPESGPPWRLTVASGCQIAVEAGTCFSQSRGPVPSRQAVVRAATHGETEIGWRLQRM